jgi:hypothetical protein
MGINVDENIERINKTILAHREEILRLEGSLRILTNMKDCGVSDIEIKQENLVESKEVVENVQGE